MLLGSTSVFAQTSICFGTTSHGRLEGGVRLPSKLHKAALNNGQNLWRVIFDPNLQPNLYRTKYAHYLEKHIKFSKKRSWVRHDEHYHVDFAIACK